MFLGATARHFNVSNEVTLLLHHCPVDWHNWEAAQKSFEQSFHWVCEPLFEFLSWQPAIFCNTCILIYHGKISQHLSCYINAVCSIFKKLLNEEAGTLQSRFAGRSRTFCNSTSKLSGSIFSKKCFRASNVFRPCPPASKIYENVHQIKLNL